MHHLEVSAIDTLTVDLAQRNARASRSETVPDSAFSDAWPPESPIRSGTRQHETGSYRVHDDAHATCDDGQVRRGAEHDGQRRGCRIGVVSSFVFSMPQAWTARTATSCREAAKQCRFAYASPAGIGSASSASAATRTNRSNRTRAGAMLTAIGAGARLPSLALRTE